MENRQKRDIKKKPIRLAILMLAAAIFSTKVEAAASEHPYFRHWEARQRDYQPRDNRDYKAPAVPNEDQLRVALSRAIAACDKSLTIELLGMGIDINTPSASYIKNSPLHEAAYYGCLEIIDLLLAKGANINALNKEGNPPLFDTLIRRIPGSDPSNVAERAMRPTVIAKLLKTGMIDVNQQFAKGAALGAFVENAMYDVVNNIPIAFLLLNAGADKSLKNKSGKTPTEIALQEAEMNTIFFPAHKRDNFLLYNLIEMYPGRTADEQIIFSIARNFYSDEPKMRDLAIEQLNDLQKTDFARKQPDLYRMLNLIIRRVGSGTDTLKK